ncbi:MAG: long-chain acyl-CoA synthetase [Candidatus Woesearchaeota archaeon]|jgi:long-chain acyl-CoA synthetase
METLNELLLNANREYPDNIAIHDLASGVKLTQREFHQKAMNVRTYLANINLKRGARVMIHAENDYHFACANAGVLLAGGVAVPTTASGDALKHQIKVTEPRILLTSAKERPTQTVSTSQIQRITSQWMTPCKAVTVRPEDPAAIIFSTGTSRTTTSKLNGIVLSQRNITSNIIASRATLPDIPNAVYATGLADPSHSFEYMVQLGMLAFGNTLAYTTYKGAQKGELAAVKPDFMIMIPDIATQRMKAFRRGIKKSGKFGDSLLRFFDHAIQCSGDYFENKLHGKQWDAYNALIHAIAKPTIYKKIRSGMIEKLGIIPHFIGGSARLDKKLQKAFYGLGITIYQGYGLTQTSPVVSVNTVNDYRFGSSGKPIDGVEVIIADIDGVENGTITTLPDGKPGHLLTHGPNVFTEYWGDKTATEADFIGGYLKTGDIAYMDDGFLYIDGRLKRMIRLANGETLMPEAIEQRYSGSEGIDHLVIVESPNAQDKHVGALIVPSLEVRQKMGVSQSIEQTLADYRVALSSEEIIRPNRIGIASVFHPDMHLNKGRKLNVNIFELDNRKVIDDLFND